MRLGFSVTAPFLFGPIPLGLQSWKGVGSWAKMVWGLKSMRLKWHGLAEMDKNGYRSKVLRSKGEKVFLRSRCPFAGPMDLPFVYTVISSTTFINKVRCLLLRTKTTTPTWHGNNGDEITQISWIETLKMNRPFRNRSKGKFTWRMRYSLFKYHIVVMLNA